VDWIKGEIIKGDEKMTVQYMGRAAVEDEITKINEKMFWLTETLPLMMEPIQSELGFLADTDAACRILNGTYTYPLGVDGTTVEFLQSLLVSEPIQPEDMIHDKSVRRTAKCTGRGVTKRLHHQCQDYTLDTGKQLQKAIHCWKYM